MSEEPQLTAEEAEEFLRLYRKVSEDMDAAFREAASDESGSFSDRFDGTSGELYTACTRNKYETFVENMYLDAD